MRNVLQMWPAIVFGWPAILLSIALSAMGIVRKKPAWLVVAAILVFPISFYLVGSPLVGWFALAVPLSLAAAGVSIYYQQTKVAWVLLAPFVGVSGWLAMMVMSE
jgi:hypothetical protein